MQSVLCMQLTILKKNIKIRTNFLKPTHIFVNDNHNINLSIHSVLY
jgi:hypothetical protein